MSAETKRNAEQAMEREAEAWEQAARATAVAEGGAGDPYMARAHAQAAATAWTRAANATAAVIIATLAHGVKPGEWGGE